MREAKANTILNQYLREKRKDGFYCYYELKVAKGLYFQFSKIEENQKEGLPALDKEGLVWKMSDEDSRKKPCDGFSGPPLPAYLVIKFGLTLYFVRYRIIQTMMDNKEVSISEDECKALSDRVIHI